MEVIYTNKIINKKNIKNVTYTTLYYAGLLALSTVIMVGITILCFG